jgi:hypothetical protein
MEMKGVSFFLFFWLSMVTALACVMSYCQVEKSQVNGLGWVADT